MSGTEQSGGKHLDAAALDRYRRRVASPDELLETDAHLASCARCHDAVRSDAETIELPPADGPEHVTYEELEAFVDGQADPLDRELIAAHVAFCTICSEELADLAAMRAGLAARSPRALHHVRLRRPRT
jgi:anti-sigma factor RsiW